MSHPDPTKTYDDDMIFCSLCKQLIPAGTDDDTWFRPGNGEPVHIHCYESAQEHKDDQPTQGKE